MSHSIGCVCIDSGVVGLDSYNLDHLVPLPMMISQCTHSALISWTSLDA